jgi:hypothetical protein
VRLFTDNNRPLVSDRPEVIAQNDQQTLFAFTPTILNLLANDQASDGSAIGKFSAIIRPSIQPKAQHGQYFHQSEN